MLVIRRKAGEAVWIDGRVRVEVVETGAGRAKLGITAPDDIQVLREEVKLTRDANIAAARGSTMGGVSELAARLRNLACAQDTRMRADMPSDG